MYDYIIIFEDGVIYKANKLSEDTLKGCADGIIDVIKIGSFKQLSVSSDLKNLDWYDIELWEV